MLKAIFEREFLELLGRLDNTLELTNYIIGSRYTSNTILTNNFVKSLFDGSYLLSDTRQTGSYPMYSIWEKDNKILKICINIDDNEKEKLVEPSNEYDFIYCYGLYPGGEEKIAIVLVNLDEGGNNRFSPLELNIFDNLIQLNFPDNTEATIVCSMTSDTKFLEGIGIISGINMFNVPDNSLGSEQLIAKKSYYKYIRNSKTCGDSTSYLYNNISGEKVYSNSYKRVYKEITLSTLEPVDSLSSGGGYIRLLGNVVFDVYKYINNYNSHLYAKDESCDIINIPYLDIIVSDNTGINIEIWGDKKKIKYGPNTSGKALSANVKLRIVNTDGEIVESPILTLNQEH